MDAKKAYAIIADAHKRAIKRKKQREQALKRASKPKREKPALTTCAMPNCNNPRAVSTSGYVHGYCKTCKATKNREQKKRALEKAEKSGICNNCFSRPCEVKDGQVFKRCSVCKEYYTTYQAMRKSQQAPSQMSMFTQA